MRFCDRRIYFQPWKRTVSEYPDYHHGLFCFGDGSDVYYNPLCNPAGIPPYGQYTGRYCRFEEFYTF